MITILIKGISKVSVFSLIGIILNGWLSYIFLSLWLHPQVDDIEFIYSLTILVLFEFILVHSGVFMSAIGRSWKGWLGLIFLYGMFALGFNAMVNGNQILILYGAVVLNRMLSGIMNRGADKEQALMMSAVYAIVYFVLLITVLFSSSYIPRCGLTEAFLVSVDYSSINQAGGDFSDAPHAFMCFGVLYYLILMFMEINAEIHRVKISLLPPAERVQATDEQPEIENEQPKHTILHQFGKGDGENDGKQPPGCGCSPLLVFVLGAVLIGIGVYQRMDDAKLNDNLVFTNGVISGTARSVVNDNETKYQISVKFTAEGKKYTIKQDYFSDVDYGDTISVVYPSRHPHKAIIAGTKISQEGLNIFIWLGIIIILAWTGLILTGRLMNRKNITHPSLKDE
jgi:hypothetical protein